MPVNRDSKTARPSWLSTFIRKVQKEINWFLFFYKNYLYAAVALACLCGFLVYVSDRSEEPQQVATEIIDSDTSLDRTVAFETAMLARLASPNASVQLLEEPFDSNTANEDSLGSQESDAFDAQQSLQSADPDTVFNFFQTLKEQTFSPATTDRQFAKLLEVIRILDKAPLRDDQRVEVNLTKIDLETWYYSNRPNHHAHSSDGTGGPFGFIDELATNADDRVSSAANGAIVAAAVVDLRLSGSNDSFVKVIETYEQHIEQALKREEGARFIGLCVLNVTNMNPLHEQCEALQVDFIRRTRESQSEEVRKLGLHFTEQLYFHPRRLKSLAARVGSIDHTDITQVFDRLKQYPDLRPAVFQGSLDIVDALLKSDETQLAKEVIADLRGIQRLGVDTQVSQLLSSKLPTYENELKNQESQN